MLGHVERMPEETTDEKECKSTPKEEDQLESQERDSWTILKMICRNWVLNAEEI
jgi:hypothetical protein